MQMYCEFKDTNMLFDNKPVYQCIYCGIKLLLEDPNNAKILCFAKKKELHEIVNGKTDSVDGLDSSSLESAAFDMVIKNNKTESIESNNLSGMIQAIKNQENKNICTQEQINERLKICSTCEYYKDSSCMLCGCVVVREANYNNKLAHKDQHCPIMKWKQITD